MILLRTTRLVFAQSLDGEKSGLEVAFLINFGYRNNPVCLHSIDTVLML